MKTTSKIFAAIFYALSAVCFAAVLMGATHQLLMMVISLLTAITLHHDSLKKVDPDNLSGDIE